MTGSSSLKAAGSRQGWPFPSSHFPPTPARACCTLPGSTLGRVFPRGFAGNPGRWAGVGGSPANSQRVSVSSSPQTLLALGEGASARNSKREALLSREVHFRNRLSSQTQPWSKGNCFMSSELLPTQTGNHFVNDGGLWLGGGRGKTCPEAWLCPALPNAPSRGSDSPALFLTSYTLPWTWPEDTWALPLGQRQNKRQQ